jgi:enoyl-CoA hydratase/carnithine racemase
LALLADVRIASPDARFAIPASKLGLVYSEAGARLVVDAFGESVARAMFLGGRVVTAEEALSTGVLTRVVGREQLRFEALDLAAAIATWSSEATSGNRQVLDAIAGRIQVDIVALHESSFSPHGALAESIADFVARRSGVLRHEVRLPPLITPSGHDEAPDTTTTELDGAISQSSTATVDD